MMKVVILTFSVASALRVGGRLSKEERDAISSNHLKKPVEYCEYGSKDTTMTPLEYDEFLTKFSKDVKMIPEHEKEMETHRDQGWTKGSTRAYYFERVRAKMTENELIEFVSQIQNEINRQVTTAEYMELDEIVLKQGCTQAELNEHWRQMRQTQKVVHSADGETDHETSTHEPFPISLDHKKEAQMTEDELIEFVSQLQNEINRQVTSAEYMELDDIVLKQGCTHTQLREHWEQMVN